MDTPQYCPLCGSESDAQTLVTQSVYGHPEAGEHAVFHCAGCDVRYLHPGLSPADESRFYAKEFEKFMSERSAEGAGWEKPLAHIAANETERLRRMSHLDPLLPKTGRILEVGCSSGFMLYPLSQRGFECIGVEPSGVFSEFVRSRDIPCFDSMDDLLADPAESEPFDIIMNYYVLEHVGDPQGFLKAQFDLLKPGGTLIFEIPHANDALTTVYDIPEYENFIWVISHRWYFSERSLCWLLSKISPEYIVRQDERYDLSNHMVWARDRKPGGTGRFTDILGTTIEENYKKALINAGRGDTLIGILTKPA